MVWRNSVDLGSGYDIELTQGVEYGFLKADERDKEILEFLDVKADHECYMCEHIKT